MDNRGATIYSNKLSNKRIVFVIRLGVYRILTNTLTQLTVLLYSHMQIHISMQSFRCKWKKKNNLVFVSRRPCFDSTCTQTNVTSAQITLPHATDQAVSVMSAALFWCAYTARGTSEYLPITRSWFAAELSQCLDKMADVNSVVKQPWCD